MRKGKYAEWFTEEGLKIVRGWARDGYSDVQIAKNIGISCSTYYDWKTRNPEFSEAIKRGRAPVIVDLEDALYRAGMGFAYKETVEEVSSTGTKSVKEYTRYAQPNVTALIFALKNLKKEKFKDKPVEEAGRDDDVLLSMLRKWDNAAEQYSGKSEAD